MSNPPSGRGGLDLGPFRKSNRPSRRGGLDIGLSKRANPSTRGGVVQSDARMKDIALPLPGGQACCVRTDFDSSAGIKPTLSLPCLPRPPLAGFVRGRRHARPPRVVVSLPLPSPSHKIVVTGAPVTYFSGTTDQDPSFDKRYLRHQEPRGGAPYSSHAQATATSPHLPGRRRQPSRPKPNLSASFLVPQAVAPGLSSPQPRSPGRGSRPQLVSASCPQAVAPGPISC